MNLFRGDRIRFSKRIAADSPAPRAYGEEDCYRDFVRVFNSPPGRRVLAQILVNCGIWQRWPLYDSEDGIAQALNSAEIKGKREIGLWLMETINWEPAEPPAHTEDEEPDV